MEEKFKELLEILLDTTPNFRISLQHTYYKSTGGKDKEDFLFYYNHSRPLAFKSTRTKETTKFVMELKNQLSIGKIKNSYIQNLKEELEKSIKSFYIFESDGTEYKIQKDAVLNNYRDKLDIVNLSNIPKWCLKEFLEFNQYKYEILTSLIQDLESLEKKYPPSQYEVPPANYLTPPEFNEEPPGLNVLTPIMPEEITLNVNKLKLNMSVPEIALLFRLLDEEKILNYKYKTDIYRFIASSFKTEKQDEISEASIKNKFISPDDTSIRNIEIFLANLRQHLKKIQ